MTLSCDHDFGPLSSICLIFFNGSGQQPDHKPVIHLDPQFTHEEVFSPWFWYIPLPIHYRYMGQLRVEVWATASSKLRHGQPWLPMQKMEGFRNLY